MAETGAPIVTDIHSRSPRDFRSFELEGWEMAAGPYADAWPRLTAQTIPALLAAARVGPGTRLVDVASGPGPVAAAAAKLGADVLGIDFSPKMVDLARLMVPTVRFLVGDAEALPLDAASCDAVVMNFGLLHLSQPEVAVTEARRVLRPGGRFAFTVWASPEDAIGFAIVLRAIQQHGDPNVPLPQGPPFFRFSDPAACHTVLGAAGFGDSTVERLPLVWHVGTPAAVFNAMHQGTARTGGLLRRQSPAALAAIRAAVLDDLDAFMHEGELQLPMPAVLASGTAP
jgi:SAM-dependent methyltransferase